jgi:hypothetical protein
MIVTTANIEALCISQGGMIVEAVECEFSAIEMKIANTILWETVYVNGYESLWLSKKAMRWSSLRRLGLPVPS